MPRRGNGRAAVGAEQPCRQSTDDRSPQPCVQQHRCQSRDQRATPYSVAVQAPHGDAAPAPPAAAVVGARVLLGGRHRATVRYVGPLEGQGGTWVGLEYDEADRGKHDGSHAGRRYFQCSLLGGPTAGSFVRLPKFLEAADAGRSLVAAARERYSSGGIAGSTGQGTSALGSEEGVGGGLYVTTAGNRRLAVELLAPAAASRRASAAGAALAVLVDQAISSVVSHWLRLLLCAGSASVLLLLWLLPAN